jgi:hypothetical protein
MKKFLILMMVIIITCSATGQAPQKISYQCVIRDANGVLVTNHSIGVRISLLKGTSTGAVVYQEIFNPNPQTNSNGLLSIEIGGGIPVTGTFSALDWASGPYFLRTETDPSGGTSYTIVGISQLLSVPYALQAKTATSADYNALSNLPELNITNWNTAYGWGNHAGLYRANSWAPAWTDVTGKPAFATVATSGSYDDLINKPAILDDQWTTSGTNIYYNMGNVGIGTTSPLALLHTEGKGEGEGNVVFVGEYKPYNPGNPPVSGAGTRMMWYPDKVAFRVGSAVGSDWDADNIGYGSFAAGEDTKASGAGSVAMGVGSDALGTYSTSIGYYNVASGHASVAIGWNTRALGTGSIALGYAEAESCLSTALGINNIGGGDATTFIATDPLFEIGNSISPSQPHNAMTVLKNGYVGLGTASPAAGLHIKADTWPGSFIYLEAGAGQDAGMRFYEGSDTKWHLYNDADAGGLLIQNNGLNPAIFCQQSNSNVGIGTTTPNFKLTVNGTAWCSSGAWTGSDIRWKKNISEITNSLSGLLELKAVNYDLKSDEFPEMGFENSRQIGLIAQDVEKIFPGLVKTDGKGYKSVSYEKLSVLLVEGMKEQQKQMDQMKKEIELLKSKK